MLISHHNIYAVGALAALILISAVAVSCSDGGGEAQNGEENEHAMGSVWAMAYPTDLVLRLADHTYVSARDSNGNTYDWLCFGTRTGGEALSGTLTEGSADITTIGFMAEQAPCKWPLVYYLRIGVCHQCANRALYYTGKTVAASEGYDFFASIYGTYGDEGEAGYSSFSMQRCIDAAPPWRGAVSPAALRESSGMTAGDSEGGAEARLYRDYVRQKNSHALQTSDPNLHGQYLDRLFSMRIRAKLGDDFPDHVIADLLGVRNRYLGDKRSMEQEPRGFDEQVGDVRERYRQLFNDLADAYRKILTPYEYETLFDLAYADEIDLNSILPP